MNEESGSELVCRVCGYSDGSPVWEHGWPTETICPCCGSQSGIEDTTLDGARSVRGYWVGNGAKWFSPKYRPKDWDLLEQISQLPPEWR